MKNVARLGIKRYDIDKDVIQLYFDEVSHSAAHIPLALFLVWVYDAIKKIKIFMYDLVHLTTNCNASVHQL